MTREADSVAKSKMLEKKRKNIRDGFLQQTGRAKVVDVAAAVRREKIW